jgi:FkbM family methyltransferase
MTTWAFNVLRQLVSSDDIETLWIEQNHTQAEAAFVSAETDMLAKCHHYSQGLAAAADVIVYSYRDIRSAAVSAHRKFGAACTQVQLGAWVESGRAWLPRAQIVLRYENVERQQLDTIRRLRALLMEKVGVAAVVQTADEEIMQRVDAEFAQMQAADVIEYDHTTLIAPGHRTFQPDPDALSSADKALYQRVEQEFAVWLADYGYIHSSEHGQELEYQIACHLLKALYAPVVVDVGVERGSFTQLACDAGAAKVLGFEPLPRHLDYLLRKYTGVDQVEILPFAVSSRSGLAELHIATDLEGNELDFHHTLSDLGDSATVVRSVRTLPVSVVSLADQAGQGRFPTGIDFLKIDTDGHDLCVLEGLADLRPQIILAEYWDSLPDTSGQNIYTLNDLATWARRHGYGRMLVIRRHGRLEFVEFDSPLTLAGDWGNVFFFRHDFDLEKMRPVLEDFANSAFKSNCKYVSGLERDCEAKEAEIRHLSAALKQRDAALALDEPVASVASQPISAQSLSLIDDLVDISQVEESDTKIKNLTAELEVATKALIEKEEVIRAVSRSLLAYRLAYTSVWPLYLLLRPFSYIARHALAVPTRFLLSPFFIIARHVRAMLSPRLGNLNQYPPRKLSLPSRSPVALPNVTPSISIVTPSFRQGAFVERTLLSVLDQRYPNLEYFVQDGGSQDSTVATLQKHNARLAGWVSEQDSGQSQAINRGFAKTSGEIMAWLNSDDLLLPGALATVADYFNRHPEVDVLYGNRLLIDEDGMEIGRWLMPGHNNSVLSWVDYVPQETLFWRRRIWNRVGGQVDESFRFAMDWDLLVRFRDAGAKFAHIPKFMGAFRIHEQQKTSANINDIGHQEMDRIRVRLLGRLPDRKEIRNAAMPYMLRHIAFDLGYRIKTKLGIRA